MLQVSPVRQSALLAQPEGSTLPVLQKAGIDAETLKARVAELIAKLPTVSGGAGQQPSLSQNTSRVLQAAFGEAEQMKDEYVSTEHILLAMASDQQDVTGKILREQGAERDVLLEALKSVRGGARVTDQDPESKYQALEKYGRDLTAVARSGKLDPVVGREHDVPHATPRRR